jgi:hypothetical protein
MFPQIEEKDGRLLYMKKGEEGLQNQLIEIYKSVLTNPNVYKDVMKSIDNDFIKDEINNLKPEINDNFISHFDPIKDIELRYSFLVGKAGVGMEANAMTDIWREGSLIVENLKSFKWGNIKEGIINLDEEYSEELSEEDIIYYANAIGKDENHKKEIITKLRKIKIGETLGTILNAFVDIAKDPYISKGNWTTSTTNVGNFMLRMGVHPLYVINFLANPIISEYNEFQKNNEGLFDKNSGDQFNKFKKYIIEKYLGDSSKGGNVIFPTLYNLYYDKLNIDYKKNKIKEEEFTKLETIKNNTIKNIVKTYGQEQYDKFIEMADRYHKQIFLPEKLDIYDRKTNQYNKGIINLEYLRKESSGKNIDLNFEITLLNEFKKLQNASKHLKQIVDFGKLDVNGIGKDPNNIFYLESLLESIKNNETLEDETEENQSSFVIKGFESKLNNTILSKYYNNLLKIKDILKNNITIFPLSQESITNIFNKIIKDTKTPSNKINDKLSLLSSQFKTYIYNRVFDLSDDYIKDLKYNLYDEVLDYKTKHPNKYFILDELNFTDTSFEHEGILVPGEKSIGLNNAEKSVEYERMFSKSWEELFENNPELAEKLVHYSFIDSGFNLTKTQFYSFIPYQYFIGLNINKKLNDIFIEDNFDEFENKFYLNNLKDASIVRNIINTTSNPIEVFRANEKGGTILYLKNKKDNYNSFNGKYYKYVGLHHSGEKHIYVEIENKLEDINYNSELKLYDFNMNLLSKQSIEEEDKIEETKQEVKSEVNNMNELTNHSGGAKGGDMVWDSIGKEYGVTNHNHYTTKYFDNLSPEEQVELSQQYLQTAKWLGRGVINSESYAGKLVRRDMIQANNSDGIFGVTELVKPGVNGRKGYVNKTNHSIPEGGTGYAVTRGILTNKPTFVFNQSDNYGNEIGWYKWDVKLNDFIKVDTPILTKNYAGIGSQEINELGIQAIRDVYEKTKNSLSEIKNINKPQQLSLFDNSQELWNENKNLLESNGMNEESFNQMYNEFGEDFIRDYIKKCKS